MSQPNMTPAEIEKFVSQMKILFPGRDVPLGNTGLSIRVSPVSYKHLREFTSAVIAATTRLVQLGIPKSQLSNVNLEDKEAMAKLLSTLMPTLIRICMSDLGDLVQACCDKPLEAVPHWLLPAVVEGWLEENFSDVDRIRPWMEAMNKLSLKLTGESAKILETFFKRLSPPVIPSTTSATDNNTGSLTADGQSPNSGTGQGEPIAEKT